MNASVQRGVSLIELVVAIVVIGIAISCVLGLLTSQASQSGNGMIYSQATHIAQSYLDEVLQKSFNDPDGINEVGRQNFDDVDDYKALSNVGARDQRNNLISGQGAFTVTISVGPGSLGGLPANQVKRVDVTVQHTTGVIVTLSGYRTQ